MLSATFYFGMTASGLHELVSDFGDTWLFVRNIRYFGITGQKNYKHAKNLIQNYSNQLHNTIKFFRSGCTAHGAVPWNCALR